MAKIIGNPVGVPNPKTNWNQTDETKADVLLNKPTKLSQFENDLDLIDRATMNGMTSFVYDKLDEEKADVTSVYLKTVIDNKNAEIWDEIDYLNGEKADRIHIHVLGREDILDDEGNPVYCHQMASNRNGEYRLEELARLSIEFEDAEYDMAYISSLSFNSKTTPTEVDYTNSGILNWVGTDCTTADGLSIFQPSANTHYDIVFYFNGVQFIGLVNGFVPATGNEAV